MPIERDTYRARLIAAREALGLDAAEMAAVLLTPRQTYSQWESGGRRTPGVAVAAAEGLARRQRRGKRGINWDAELKRAREEGLNRKQLADRVGVAPPSVGYALRSRGERLPDGRARGIDWDRRLGEAARAGLTASELARSIGVTPASVYAAARHRGVALKKERMSSVDWAAEHASAVAAQETQAQVARRLGTTRQNVSERFRRLRQAGGKP